MGKCACTEGWEGNACECPKGNQTCLDSKGVSRANCYCRLDYRATLCVSWCLTVSFSVSGCLQWAREMCMRPLWMSRLWYRDDFNLWAKFPGVWTYAYLCPYLCQWGCVLVSVIFSICMYKCLRKCSGIEKIKNFKNLKIAHQNMNIFFVLFRLSWACVRLQEVVSSVRLGRQERIKRKRSVISVLSKLPW